MCDVSLFRFEEGLMPPHIENLVREIARDEGLKEYRIGVAPGSFKGDNYLGQINQVRISADGREDIALVIKISPTGKHLRESVPVNVYYNREIHAYSKSLPTLVGLHAKSSPDTFKFAKFYKGITEEGRETVILEDLTFKGFRSHDKTKPLDLTHLKIVIRALAQYHATSFVMQRTDVGCFEELTSRASRELEYHDMLGKVMECTKKTFLSSFENPDKRMGIAIYLEDMLDKFGSYVRPETTAPYNVLCHGDCWTNNFLFMYDKADRVIDVRFLDWQLIRFASPVTDLMYMMFSSTDEKTRALYFDQMLDYYYETLSSCISSMGQNASELYPESVYKEHVEKIKPFGLISSSVVLPEDEDEDDTNIKGEPDEIRFTIAFAELCKDHIRGAAKDFLKN